MTKSAASVFTVIKLLLLPQGNIFTPVCDSVHSRVSVPACTTGHMTRGVSVLGGLCPGGTLSRGSLSRGASLSGDLCPGGMGSLSRGVSVRETPPYGKERAVCILLKCIRVENNFVNYFKKLK